MSDIEESHPNLNDDLVQNNLINEWDNDFSKILEELSNDGSPSTIKKTIKPQH